MAGKTAFCYLSFMEIVTVVIIVLALYLVANFVSYFAQERFLFKPEKLPKDFEFKYPNQKFQEYNLEKEPGVNISGYRKLERGGGLPQGQ